MTQINKPADAAAPISDEQDDKVIAHALLWSLAVFAALAMIAGGAFLIWFFVGQSAPVIVDLEPQAAPMVRTANLVSIPELPWTDITDSAGLKFRHTNGAKGEKLLPETMGGGCAFLDYNGDGFQDILFVNSCYWPGERPEGAAAPTMALYQNDGNGNFADVTGAANLQHTLYGMGVAVGDYDNDGWCDVFVSAVGENRLYHNEQGRFVDVTEAAGIGGGDQWSTSCGWFDYNKDGRLDLFVCNYVKWTAEIDLRQDSSLDGINRAYLPPNSFEGTFSSLYRNEGDGRFSDVSAESGIQVKNSVTDVPAGKALGVSFIDCDNDGWMDVFVANDTVRNFLFHNQQNGGFEEIGAVAGIAYDSSGQARGAMGIDTARIRGGQSLGVVVGNFANEMTALYVDQDVSMNYADEAIATGLGPLTRLQLTFGVFFFDADLDGRLDICAANGHLEEEISKTQNSQRYEQAPQLFWNAGGDSELATEFPPVPESNTGADFCRPMVGRGATYADIDGDGDLDVLFTACGASPRLLRNDQQLGHHWVRIRLVGKHCNRDAIGAWIEVHASGQTFWRQVSNTRSYLSQSEVPVTIGLGDASSIERVVIHWPDGSDSELADLEIDRAHVIAQR